MVKVGKGKIGEKERLSGLMRRNVTTVVSCIPCCAEGALQIVKGKARL